MKEEPLISLEHVSMHFFNQDGVLTVLDDISVQLQQGEISAMLGPSGCGKSTILNILSGLLEPTGGAIERHGSIGYMFQRDHLLDWRTIYDNVLIGLEIQKQKNSEVHLQKVERLLRTYGLWEFRKRYPGELSGGMRQRAALLRTYLFSQDVALLDEPFSALDTLTKSAIHKWYLAVMEKIKLSTFFITHDIDEAILLSDRVYLLSGQPGQIKAEIPITEPKPRPADFNLTPEFLAYKKRILELL